mmetsp:Transcript_18819/g.63587  ORF Transcript_18819/g.63587 Transcript_18819/m.63587 type:complete len:126 (+) Transcript_18819:764-1141(+)
MPASRSCDAAALGRRRTGPRRRKVVRRDCVCSPTHRASAWRAHAAARFEGDFDPVKLLRDAGGTRASSPSPHAPAAARRQPKQRPQRPRRLQCLLADLLRKSPKGGSGISISTATSRVSCCNLAF